MRTLRPKEDEIWLVESPITMIEGEEFTFGHTWEDADSVATGTLAVYKKGTNVTTDVTTGAHSIAGAVHVWPTIKSLVGGETYVAVIGATVDGNVQKRKLMIYCVRPSENQ